MFDFTIWTDGGCAKNPNGKGGYGIVIKDNISGAVTKISEGFKSTTNNRMEVRAIIRALENIPSGSTVKLYSDSKYAVMCFTGAYKKKKNLDLWDLADKVIDGIDVSFEWVKGHADNDNNNLCDEMASEAMNKNDSELIVDDGFVPISPKNKKSKSSDKSISQIIESNNDNQNSMSDVVVEPMIPDAFVDNDCYVRICAINANLNPSFDDFARLSLPYDFWSFQPMSALAFYFGNCILSYVRSYFCNDVYVIEALRWYGRGLTIENAVRKVLIDIKISNQISEHVIDS